MSDVVASRTSILVVGGTIVAFAAQEAGHAAVIPHLSERYKAFPPQKQALWLNTASSLLHASLCAAGVVGCALGDDGGWRALLDAPLTASTEGSEVVIAFSLGYFLFDTVSMAAKGLFAKAPSLIAHHVVVAAIQVMALARRSFHPLVLAMLAAEVNSVFLHMRGLLRSMRAEQDPARGSALYRIVRALLFASFVPCRFVAHGWVVLALWRVRKALGMPMWLLATGASLVVNFLNLQLWSSLVRAETPRKAALREHVQ